MGVACDGRRGRSRWWRWWRGRAGRKGNFGSGQSPLACTYVISLVFLWRCRSSRSRLYRSDDCAGLPPGELITSATARQPFARKARDSTSSNRSRLISSPLRRAASIAPSPLSSEWSSAWRLIPALSSLSCAMMPDIVTTMTRGG